MNQINSPGLNNLLSRRLTIKGDEAPAPVLGTEIIPTLVLEQDRPEWLFLQNTKVGYAKADVLATPTVTGKLTLENPSTSGVLCIVEHIDIVRGDIAAGSENIVWNLFWGTPPLIADVANWRPGAGWLQLTPQCLDARWNNQQTAVFAGTAVIAFQDSASAISGTGIFLTDGGALGLSSQLENLVVPTKRLHRPVILPPGWGLKLTVQATAGGSLPYCMSATWLERRMEPNEGGV